MLFPRSKRPLMKVGGKTKDLVTVSTEKLEAEPYKNIIYYRISAIYFGSTDPSSGMNKVRQFFNWRKL